ncbi:MAG TPA: hypothetical protein H9908_02285, partial [Candidatus Rothia avistercoris]|nr:hypothetical protein [Candidatus Rothia avistercoris]
EFRILDKDFTEAEGHLTPSMKVRRKQVLADFNSYVEDMYNRTKSTVTETAAHTAERVQELRAEQTEKWDQFKASQAEKIQEFTEAQGQKLHELADKIQQVAPLPGAKDKDAASSSDTDEQVEKAASD